MRWGEGSKLQRGSPAVHLGTHLLVFPLTGLFVDMALIRLLCCTLRRPPRAIRLHEIAEKTRDANFTMGVHERQGEKRIAAGSFTRPWR